MIALGLDKYLCKCKIIYYYLTLFFFFTDPEFQINLVLIHCYSQWFFSSNILGTHFFSKTIRVDFSSSYKVYDVNIKLSSCEYHERNRYYA